MENSTKNEQLSATNSVKAEVQTKQTQGIKRESGLELLRIIAMLLIVMHHVYLYSGIVATGWGENLLRVFGAGGKFGVNIFILISAYFMVNKKFKLSRVLNVVFQTTFYSIIIFTLFVIFGGANFTVKSFIFALFPVFYSQWWFVTAFVILMLLSPALNIILNSVNKKTLGVSICCMVAFSVLFPYVNRLILQDYFEVPYLNDLFIFIELYFVGGYIKLHGINLKKIWVIVITIAALIFGLTLTYFGEWRELGIKMNSFSSVVCAIGLLLIFKDFKFKSRIINAMASTTFGIYLIHENNYIRDWCYNFFKETFYPWINSNALMFLFLTLTVFVFCMIIDYIRIQTVHRGTNKLLKLIDKTIENRKQKNSNIKNEEEQSS